jgi:hypothetical protein
MIGMAVRHEQFLDRHAGLCGCRLQLRQVAAGVDERPAHRLRAPDERAILLEGRDRDDRGAERLIGRHTG